MGRMAVMQVISGVDIFLNALSILLILYALMSWLMRPNNPVYVALSRMANVALAPFRPIGRWLINKGMRIDPTLFITLFVIQILRNLLVRLSYSVWMY